MPGLGTPVADYVAPAASMLASRYPLRANPMRVPSCRLTSAPDIHIADLSMREHQCSRRLTSARVGTDSVTGTKPSVRCRPDRTAGALRESDSQKRSTYHTPQTPPTIGAAASAGPRPLHHLSSDRRLRNDRCGAAAPTRAWLDRTQQSCGPDRSLESQLRRRRRAPARDERESPALPTQPRSPTSEAGARPPVLRTAGARRGCRVIRGSVRFEAGVVACGLSRGGG